MLATVIAERIGWPRGITVLKERVAELRRLFVEPRPQAAHRIRPGELAQWDLWFPPVEIPVGYDHAAKLNGAGGLHRAGIGRDTGDIARQRGLLRHHGPCLRTALVLGQIGFGALDRPVRVRQPAAAASGRGTRQHRDR